MKENNIDFEFQKRFKNCKDKNTLPFDFYIISKNICIEFDGEQHNNIIEYFGGKKGFRSRQRRDQIKNKFCKDNNISLVRIPYRDIDNIEQILDKSLT